MPNGNGNGNNTTPLSDALHETAARGVEAIHVIVQQRDDLLKQVTRLTTDLLLYKERNHQLDSRLAVATAERDHFMRYCTEITTKLNNLQTLIVSAIEESKHAAYKPTQTVTTGKKLDNLLTQEEAGELHSLLHRLKPASDTTNP